MHHHKQQITTKAHHLPLNTQHVSNQKAFTSHGVCCSNKLRAHERPLWQSKWTHATRLPTDKKLQEGFTAMNRRRHRFQSNMQQGTRGPCANRQVLLSSTRVPESAASCPFSGLQVCAIARVKNVWWRCCNKTRAQKHGSSKHRPSPPNRLTLVGFVTRARLASWSGFCKKFAVNILSFACFHK